MNVRHANLKNEEVNTRYGIVKLDRAGMVTNIDDLTGSPEQLVMHVPGFVNADLFPSPEASRAAKEIPAKTPTPTVSADQEEGKYAAVIKELLEKGTMVNNEGYIDMGVLNEELRKREMKILTGTRRKEISDKHNLKALPTQDV